MSRIPCSKHRHFMAAALISQRLSTSARRALASEDNAHAWDRQWTHRMVGVAEVFMIIRNVYKIPSRLTQLSVGHGHLAMCILECGDLQAFLRIERKVPSLFRSTGEVCDMIGDFVPEAGDCRKRYSRFALTRSSMWIVFCAELGDVSHEPKPYRLPLTIVETDSR